MCELNNSNIADEVGVKMLFRRNITLVIFTLIMLLLSGIVYASTAGFLLLEGTVVFSSNVDLNIIEAKFSAATPERDGESVSIPLISNYKTLSINVDLLEPGDKRIITFKIQNVGNVSAELGELNVSVPDIGASGLKITWPDLENEVISPGQTTTEYQIVGEWDVNYPNVTNGSHNFSSTIIYMQGI